MQATQFVDVSKTSMKCDTCGSLHDKSNIVSPFVVHVTDMSPDDFKKSYCTNCPVYSICWTGKCYNKYYANAKKLFFTPEGFGNPEVSDEKFKEFLIKNPAVLLIYATFALEYLPQIKTEKYKTLEDFIPSLKEILEKVGNNLDFLKSFFLDGWFIREQSYFYGASPKSYRPTVPVLFTYDEAHTKTQSVSS